MLGPLEFFYISLGILFQWTIYCTQGHYAVTCLDPLVPVKGTLNATAYIRCPKLLCASNFVAKVIHFDYPIHMRGFPSQLCDKVRCSHTFGPIGGEGCTD